MPHDHQLHGVRSTEDVFLSHLDFRRKGMIEEDLATNYAPDVVLLTVNSNARGYDAIRKSAGLLARQLPDAQFEFLAKQVNGNFALLIWRARSTTNAAIDGADTFVIENGMIHLQTIHYRLMSADGS